MSRLPAYGRALLDALRAGRVPAHGIAVWIDQTPPSAGICAPLAIFQDTDPATLDWGLCHAQTVIVPHADRVQHDRLLATVRKIRKAGPLRLLLLKDSAPGFEIVVSSEVRHDIMV